jgi:OOP family OmpA-OmpF porin
MLQTLKGLIGLPVLAGIVYFGAQSLAVQVEAELRANSERAVSQLSEGLLNAKLKVSGRDLAIDGLAVSEADREKAIASLSNLPGVGKVGGGLRVLSTVKPFLLAIERHGSSAVITGFAPPGNTRSALRDLLAKLGLKVEDRAEWALGAPEAFSDLAAFATARLASLDPGLARLSDATLSLSGEARPEVDYAKFLLAAASPPAGSKTVELKVAPSAVSPFVFSAKLGAGGLRLEGSAPYQDLEELRASAPRLFHGGAISDALAPAGGAPRNFSAAVAAGLQALAELRQGELVISDRLVSLTGEAKPASALAESLALRLPQGYGLVLQLTPPSAATP